MLVRRVVGVFVVSASLVLLPVAPASAKEVGKGPFTVALRAALQEWADKAGPNFLKTSVMYGVDGVQEAKGVVAINGDGSILVKGDPLLNGGLPPTRCVKTKCWVYDEESGKWLTGTNKSVTDYREGIDAFVGVIEQASPRNVTFSIDGDVFKWVVTEKGQPIQESTIVIEGDTFTMVSRDRKNAVRSVLDIDAPVTPVKKPPARDIA